MIKGAVGISFIGFGFGNVFKSKRGFLCRLLGISLG